MAYEWKKKLACIATYKLMERDDRMNQFEEIIMPFDKAKALKMGDLKFYPSAATPEIKNKAAKHFGATFLKYLVQDYVVKKESKDIDTGKIFEQIVNVLKDETKTLNDLAEVIDKNLKFEDE